MNKEFRPITTILVRATLNQNPTIPAEFKYFFESIINENLPAYYLKRFRDIKDKYSDELPMEDVCFTIDAGISEDCPADRTPKKCVNNKVREILFSCWEAH